MGFNLGVALYTRFRAANTSTSNEKSALSPQKSNAFAQRRAKLSSSSPTTPKSVISRSNSIITYDAQDVSDGNSNAINTEVKNNANLVEWLRSCSPHHIIISSRECSGILF